MEAVFPSVQSLLQIILDVAVGNLKLPEIF